jgi:hypothetical protein
VQVVGDLGGALARPDHGEPAGLLAAQFFDPLQQVVVVPNALSQLHAVGHLGFQAEPEDHVAAAVGHQLVTAPGSDGETAALRVDLDRGRAVPDQVGEPASRPRQVVVEFDAAGEHRFVVDEVDQPVLLVQIGEE